MGTVSREKESKSRNTGQWEENTGERRRPGNRQTFFEKAESGGLDETEGPKKGSDMFRTHTAGMANGSRAERNREGKKNKNKVSQLWVPTEAEISVVAQPL